MADQNIIELIVEGAERSVRQIQSVAQAQTDLVLVQQSAGVRQRQVYDSIAAAAEQTAKIEEESARRAETSAKLRVAALSRVRDELGRFLSEQQVFERQLAQQNQTAGTNLQNPSRLAAAIGAAQFTAARQAQEAALARAQAEQQRIAAGVAQAGGLRATTLTPDQLQVRQQAAQFTATRTAMAAQQAAAQTLQGRLQALGSTIAGLAGQLKQLATGSNSATSAMDAQAAATSNVQQRSVTYLSVLSAIHAASFLATNQTFSLLGSFVTLGAAFGKMGLAAGAAGLALGGILAIFGQVSQAVQQVQQFVIGSAETVAKFAVGLGAAAVAAGAAGVKIAGGVETQLAGVRAFGQATTQQLQAVSEQATELSNRFGVSAASVVEATSLFARAGGTVEQAIGGATEAIIKLQIASQGELSAAQAAIAVSAALQQFKAQGVTAAQVADNLAAAMQGSALSALGVQQAFIQAAPGAATLGISIEDTSAAVALLGDQLIKGTTTGTAFKQFILDIIKPSKEAQAVFSQYGIAVQDANNNALPFIEILGNIKKGLEDVTPLQREQALATIFGSRAFLAANIFTEEGAAGLQRYRDELAQTTASNIVDVLLLPMEAQLKRVQAAAENTGRAFGGPLLSIVSGVASQVVDALQGIAPAAQLAGQAISVVLTGQGFAALQVAIDNLVGHNNLASFFIELVNSARNVVDVIQSQIIPAIQNFISTVAGAAGSQDALDGIGRAFDGINGFIQRTGAAVAGAIEALGNLVVEFAKAEGAGGNLRTTIETVARAIISNLVASLVTTAVTIQAAIVAMPILSRAALLTAQAALQLSRALVPISSLLINIIELGKKWAATSALDFNITKGVDERLADFDKAMTAAENEAKSARGQLHLLSDTGEELDTKIASMLKTVEGAKNPFDQLGAASAENARIARSSISDIIDEIVRSENINVELLSQEDVNKLIERAGAMKQAAIAGVNPILQVFEDAQGSIATAVDNINKTIDQKTREAEQRKPGAGAGVVKVDQAAVDKETAKIDKSFRSLATQIDHDLRDAGTRSEEAVKASTDRIADIVTSTTDRLKQIERDRKEAIDDLLTNTAQQRTDRGLVQGKQQEQEDILTAEQRRLDQEATLEQRSLDLTRTARQQDQQDADTLRQREISDVEKTEQRRVDLVERAFNIIQQARETAFSRSQDVELTSFQRTQQAAAEARNFALQLANAKTPEDRQKLQVGHQQALADTRFQQGQEDALTKFRQAQEDKRTKFQNQQALEALQFRQNQEDTFTTFRQGNEDRFLAYKRGVEAREKIVEQGEDDALLLRRQAREDQLAEFRRKQALDLQKFQDDIEDAASQRRIARINREAGEARDKAVQSALEQIGKVQEELSKGQDKALDQLKNQLQNVIDQADNLKESLKESLPPEIFSAVSGRLDSLIGSLKGAAGSATQDFKDTQKAASDAVDAAVAVGQAQIHLAGAQVNPAITTTVPTQVIAVQTIQAASVVLPVGFTDGVAAAVRLGIQQAVDQDILPGEFNIDLTPIEDGVESIRRSLRG